MSLPDAPSAPSAPTMDDMRNMMREELSSLGRQLEAYISDVLRELLVVATTKLKALRQLVIRAVEVIAVVIGGLLLLHYAMLTYTVYKVRRIGPRVKS